MLNLRKLKVGWDSIHFSQLINLLFRERFFSSESETSSIIKIPNESTEDDQLMKVIKTNTINQFFAQIFFQVAEQ